MNTDQKVNQTLIRCIWSYQFSSKVCKHTNLWLCRQLESSAGFRFCFVSCQKRRAARRLPGTVFIINTILHRATGVCAPHPAAQGNFTSNKRKSRPIYQTYRDFFLKIFLWFSVPKWKKSSSQPVLLFQDIFKKVLCWLVKNLHFGIKNVRCINIFIWGIPHICHFFTRAKFLANKIYTEKRQFFALNL